jgi:hypothetical protein
MVCTTSFLARSGARGAAAVCLFLLLNDPGRAEILLEGSAAAVRLEVTQAAPVGSVLDALGPAYHVRYRALVPLDKPITGSYSGPLARVIARVLEGYDYVVRTSPGAVEIAYIRVRGGPEPVAASTKPAAGWRLHRPSAAEVACRGCNMASIRQ